jgi:phospholipid transport system substrate-binding protein
VSHHHQVTTTGRRAPAWHRLGVGSLAFGLLTAGLITALSMAAPAAAGTPTEDLKKQTDQVLQVLRTPSLTPQARRAAVRDLALETFDLTETARRALGTHWQGRTPAQREEFVQVFRDLLEQTYVARIDEYGGERLEYISEKVDGDAAIVRAQIVTKSGASVPVESRLNQRGGRWLVYDVLIENVSLVGNYRSQFDRIIRTSSFDDLVRRLKERVAELSNQAARTTRSGASTK